jgi:hypothetical protein
VRAVTAALIVAAVVVAAASAAAPPAGVKVIGTRGVVASIAADGPRVAIVAEEQRVSGGCGHGSVWTPGTGKVVRIDEKNDCYEGSSSRHDNLTLAGTRVAWVDYDYGNHAYCDGPYTTTLAAPARRTALPSDCDGTLSDVYFRFAGDGNVLVESSHKVCEVEGICTDDNGDPLPEGIYRVEINRVVGAKLRPVVPTADMRWLDGVAGTRVLVEEKGSLNVYSLAGRTLTSIPGTVDAARLAGTNVVAAKGKRLTVYGPDGKVVAQRRIAVARSLNDAEGGLVVYGVTIAGEQRSGKIHVLRLSDGRDRVIATVPRPVGADLESTGLFYAYNETKGEKPGRVVFMPTAVLASRMG